MSHTAFQLQFQEQVQWLGGQFQGRSWFCNIYLFRAAYRTEGDTVEGFLEQLQCDAGQFPLAQLLTHHWSIPGCLSYGGTPRQGPEGD